MKKQIVAAAAGGVWLAAIASAATLVYTLNRSPVPRTVVAPPWSSRVLEIRPERRSAGPELIIEMPTMFVTARPPGAPSASTPSRGVAEMQPADEVLIGPGTVTHPK
jgi:hypothetical protein